MLVLVDGSNRYTRPDVGALAVAAGVPDGAIEYGLEILETFPGGTCPRPVSEIFGADTIRQTSTENPSIGEGFEISIGDVEWLGECAAGGPRYIAWSRIPSRTTAAEPTSVTPPTRTSPPAPTPTRAAQSTSQPARSGRNVLDMNIEEALSELSQWNLREENPELYARIFCLDEGPCDWSLKDMEDFTGIITNETTGEELNDYMIVMLVVDGYDVYGAGVSMITDAGETSKPTPIPRYWEILGQDWIQALGLPGDVADQMSEYLEVALSEYGRPETFKDYADIGDFETGMFVGNALELYVADCTAAWCERDH